MTSVELMGYLCGLCSHPIYVYGPCVPITKKSEIFPISVPTKVRTDLRLCLSIPIGLLAVTAPDYSSDTVSELTLGFQCLTPKALGRGGLGCPKRPGKMSKTALNL